VTIPPGYTEQSVLATIDKVVGILASKFVFGSFALDDLKQEGRLYAVEALTKGRYNPARPLENFLYTHIRNRFCNLKRQHLRRTDTPCRACYNNLPCGPDGQVCDAFRKWNNRQKMKVNLAKALDISNISDTHEPTTRSADTTVDAAEVNELAALIDENLSVEIRADYLRMREGETVSKGRRQRVQQAVAEILVEYGLDAPGSAKDADEAESCDDELDEAA
jgi:DNA-directed RNA polymerase specialized sigma24 family protein